MAEIKTKQELLDKLRSYASTPDDENIRYKNTIMVNGIYSSEKPVISVHIFIFLKLRIRSNIMYVIK